MYHEIMNSGLLFAKAHVTLYPEFINKIHNHGTLTKGIYLNMESTITKCSHETRYTQDLTNMLFNIFNI